MGASLAPLAHPAFRWLLAGRFTTIAGNAMAPIALAFAVLDLTSSITSLGIVVAARSLTNVVFLLWGGVVADRLPRHLVLAGSCAVSFASQALIAVLVLTGTASVTWFVVLSAVNGMSSAFSLPASAALVPQTVPADLRLQANALLRLGLNSARIGGAALGGLLIAFTGPGWGLAVDALSFALAGVFFAFVRVPAAHVAAEHKPSVLAELKVGWTEFVSRQWVWVVVVAFTFVNAALVGGVMVLGPVLADTTFGREMWGLILAAQTAGMVSRRVRRDADQGTAPAAARGGVRGGVRAAAGGHGRAPGTVAAASHVVRVRAGPGAVRGGVGGGVAAPRPC